MKCCKEGCEARIDYEVYSMYNGTSITGEYDKRYCCKDHLDDAMEFDNTMVVASVHPTIIGRHPLDMLLEKP